MFNISTKGDYGLLLLSVIADNMKYKKEYTSLREVAKSKKLPAKYLSEIALRLKKAKILVSKEGREGGYRLAKNPQNISLIEVLEVLEGPVEPVKCCSRSKICTQEKACGVKSIWQQATLIMKEFLKNKTLADTIEESRSTLIHTLC